jgi:hypothetical protein
MGPAVVRQLWQRIEGRDWPAVAALLAPDVVIDWPHTGERIIGRDNFVGVNRDYPEGWDLRVERVVEGADATIAHVRVEHDGRTYHGVGIYQVSGGLIARGTEFWITERGEEPPAWRAKYAQRS